MPSIQTPLLIVISGVSGSGKSTTSKELYSTLNQYIEHRQRSIVLQGAVFLEGDDYHPPSNKLKMSSGQPLNDQDREPWLKSIVSTVDSMCSTSTTASTDVPSTDLETQCAPTLPATQTLPTPSQAPPRFIIVACSALKRVYRDILRMAKCKVCFLLLHGSRQELKERLDARVGHFMKSTLLDSQLSTLELPSADGPEGDVHVIDIDGKSVDEILSKALDIIDSVS
jgi:gluconokinase